MSDLTIIVLAKEPAPGRVKTRLTPAVTPEQAAELAQAALADTLETVTASSAERRVLALEGNPGGWVPEGFDVIGQVAGGLDDRLAGAFDSVTGPAILIGMDTPQLTPGDLDVTFDQFDSWLGPTIDGGFWAVAFAEPDSSVFPGVPMSTDHTFDDQLERMQAAGHHVGILPFRRDVDTIIDAQAVAELIPESRFAMELMRIESALVWPEADAAYRSALQGGADLRLSCADGRIVDFEVDRWLSPADAADRTLLDRCVGTTLDIGCGPGRLTSALSARGHDCLGVDITQTAVDLTRSSGGSAICQSVFEQLPSEGCWDTVLLADGNLGIAGNPQRLLARVRELLRPGGRLLIEPQRHEADEVIPVRIEGSVLSRHFLWAQVGPEAALRRAIEAGFTHRESWSIGNRHFHAFTL